MSRENVEMARRAIEGVNRRELRLDWAHPDIEWIEDPRYPGAETFRGPEGVERSLRKWWDAWDIEADPEEFIDLGEQVVVVGHNRFRGHGSDLTLAAEFATVFEFRDGKVARARVLGTRQEAFEAVGLRE